MTSAGKRYPVVRTHVDHERDILTTRNRARHLADLVQLPSFPATRFATAVSELARDGVDDSSGVTVKLLCNRTQLIADITWTSAPTAKWLRLSTERVAPLVDDMQARAMGVELVMNLPHPLALTEIGELGEKLAQQLGADPLRELARQNRELLETLGRLRMAEETTRLMADEHSTILALVPGVVFATGAEGGWDFTNRRWEEQFGIPALDQEWLSAIASDRHSVAQEYAAGIGSQEPFELECTFRTLQLGQRWMRLRAEPYVEAGAILRWFGTITDIDDAKRRAQEAQRVADYSKRIIGVVGHDLRAPIGVVLGVANMLEATDDLDVKQTMVKRLKSSSARATHMINGLLDYTRAELGGGLPIERTPCDLRPALEELVKDATTAHPNHDFQLTVNGDLYGNFDDDRIVQAVGNLVENAAAHADRNCPIRLSAVGHDAYVALAVQNRGPVVPQEVRARAFQPFRRGAQQRLRGLGLGLFIVKQIAVGHGGSTSMESSEQDGTTVTMTVARSTK